MKKITVVVLSLVLVSNLAFAKGHKSSKEEVKGAAGGAAIGAIAGGPVGAIVGAVIGVIVGDRLHVAKKRGDEAVGSLVVAEESNDRLKQDLRLADQQIIHLEQTVEAQTFDHYAIDGLSIDVMFKTAEYEMSEKSNQQLNELSALVAALPKLKIRLDGYADPRGTLKDNALLASKRTDYVYEQLLASGVPDSRIVKYSHGEINYGVIDSDLDEYALERRVSIRFFIDNDAGELAQE